MKPAIDASNGTRGRARMLAALLLVVVLYYSAARIGLQLQFQESQASPVWPPSGVAFAALMLLGNRGGFAVFAGILIEYGTSR